MLHNCADMAELADAMVLGAIGRPCRFESCYPQGKVRCLPDFLILPGFSIAGFFIAKRAYPW